MDLNIKECQINGIMEEQQQYLMLTQDQLVLSFSKELNKDILKKEYM